MHMLVSEMLEADAVSEGFAAGLEGKSGVHISQGKPLPVHSAHRQPPELITVLGESS